MAWVTSTCPGSPQVGKTEITPAWQTYGEFSMSLNDKLSELKSLLAFDWVHKSIVTTATTISSCRFAMSFFFFFFFFVSVFLAVCTGRGRPSKSSGGGGGGGGVYVG